MPDHTQYDELHDKYQPDFEGGNDGTRYERLTTLVFKSIEATGAVIHDRKQRGDADVPHQIDVLIEAGGQTRRTIVECKALGKAKVGLGIVRDFKGVIADIHPDRAIIVTTVGFTPYAQKYAARHGIELAILRTLPEGYLREYSIDIKYSIDVPNAGLGFSTEQANARHIAILAAADATRGVTPGTVLYVRKRDEQLSYFAFIQRMLREHDAVLRRDGTMTITIADWMLEGETDQMPLEYLQLTLHTEVGDLPTAVGIAELLLEGLGEPVVGRDSDLRRRIDKDTNEVR